MTPVEVRIALTVAAVLLAFQQPRIGEAVRHIEQTQSLVHDGTFAIDEVMVRKGELDPSLASGGRYPYPDPGLGPPARLGHLRDRAWHDGHFYPGVGPGLCVAMVPAYWTLDVAARRVPALRAATAEPRTGIAPLWLGALTMVLPSAAMAVLVHRCGLALGLDARSAVLLALGWALGTPAFSHGAGLNPWQLINAATWFGLATLLVGVPTPRRSFAAGAGLGLAVSLNYLAAALLPVFVVAALRRHGRRPAAALAGGWAAGVLPLLVYHAALLGGPLTTPYARRIDPHVAAIMASGFQGFLLPSPRVALLLLIGPAHGIFVHAPLAVLAFAALRRADARPVAAFGVAAFGLFLALNAAREHDWDAGGGDFGPRYLLPGLPFLWLLAALGARDVRPLALDAAFVVSVLVNAIGAMYSQWGPPLVIAVKFLVRGPQLPAIAWAGTVLRDRATPTSSVGALAVLGLLLWFVWRRPACAPGPS